MFSLKSEKRNIFGKAVKNLINQGSIPAEVYGRGIENMHLQISLAEFRKLYKEAGKSSIINLDVEGKICPVIIQDVQMDLLGDTFHHIDFYQVNMNEEITAEIPLTFIGESPAVKEKAGILVKAVEFLEVESLPGDLPQTIEVDISSIVDIHQSVHLKDIKIPKGVKVMADPETVLVTVTEQAKEEEVVVPVAEEVPVEGAGVAPQAESHEEKKE